MTDEYEHDTAHMFRVYFDPEPDDEEVLFDWMEQWLLNWSPWETEHHGPNEVAELRLREDEPDYYAVDWWFSYDEDTEIIYGHIIGEGGQITELTARADWACAAYHECPHPGGESGCEWDEVRTHGDVPGERLIEIE